AIEQSRFAPGGESFGTISDEHNSQHDRQGRCSNHNRNASGHQMMAQNEKRIDAWQRANSSFAPHAYDFYRHSVFYAGGRGECNSRAKSIWVGATLLQCDEIRERPELLGVVRPLARASADPTHSARAAP